MSHLFVRHDSHVPAPADQRPMVLLVLLVALLAGCQPVSQDTGARRWIGQSLPALADVNSLALPEQLAGFALQGEMAGERGSKRIALYRDHASGETVTLTLYSLPGGWDDYSAERRVSGHYIPVRNDFGRRLLKRGAQSVGLISEQMPDGDPALPAQASAIIEAQPAIRSSRIAFVLSCTDQVFVIVSQEGSSDLDSLKRLQELSASMVAQLHQSNR